MDNTSKDSQFRLTAVERLRQWQRDEHVTALHKVDAQWGRLKQESADAAAQLHGAQSAFRRDSTKPSRLFLTSWTLLHDYSRAQAGVIADKQKEIEQVVQERAQCADALRVAMAQLKAIEKLRQRQAKAVQVADRRAAYSQFDEEWQMLSYHARLEAGDQT